MVPLVVGLLEEISSRDKFVIDIACLFRDLNQEPNRSVTNVRLQARALVLTKKMLEVVTQLFHLLAVRFLTLLFLLLALFDLLSTLYQSLALFFHLAVETRAFLLPESTLPIDLPQVPLGNSDLLRQGPVEAMQFLQLRVNDAPITIARNYSLAKPAAIIFQVLELSLHGMAWRVRQTGHLDGCCCCGFAVLCAWRDRDAVDKSID
jgi:hypothetical protein